MMASLHAITPGDKKGLCLISLGFTLLFAMAVSINCFVLYIISGLLVAHFRLRVSTNISE